MDRLAIFEVYAMVIPATGFPFLYATFYRWWRKPIGRALMTKAVGLLLLIDLSAAALVFADANYRYPLWVAHVVYALVAAGLWYQFVVFLGIRFGRNGKRKP